MAELYQEKPLGRIYDEPNISELRISYLKELSLELDILFLSTEVPESLFRSIVLVELIIAFCKMAYTFFSGCRADASEAAIILLPSNITVFALDFSGSGLSEGDHVTLGYNEKDDLRAVVNHLRADANVSFIGLWGRSMGAVTCLMYGAEDPSIAGMVLDSPFSNLVELMMELVDTYKYPLPKFTLTLIHSVTTVNQCSLNELEGCKASHKSVVEHVAMDVVVAVCTHASCGRGYRTKASYTHASCGGQYDTGKGRTWGRGTRWASSGFNMGRMMGMSSTHAGCIGSSEKKMGAWLVR
ncbi:hypothetical protein AXF42_Ash012213 [Apostasia shenzhenica]|uniref:Serine aminopeptidase S33 domain-containing protein n=1 Tax=Apostasia shenzhenica TaxID=1088818 RepID=A0A2I0B4A1_9ASPA|nr:hypothetical protein AXF42_Ash012213 [Apostasia shenzhenica]